MECYGCSQAGSIKKLDRAGWGQTQNDLAPGWAGTGSRRSGQATDVPVAKPVEDQGEQSAGGGDLADVGAASFADADPGLPDRPGADTLRRLHGRPAHQCAALFGDPAAVHLRIGLTVGRGQPGPGGQLLGPLEAGDIADLGDEDRGQYRTDTVDGLDGPETRDGRTVVRWCVWPTCRSRR